jgi:CheY-like chemotaxis protein
MMTTQPKPKHILIIDDEKDEADLIMRSLESEHLADAIHVARDGAEAIDYFFGPGAETRPTPDLVLLDLRLPKVDGTEVLRRLRSEAKTKFLPIVVFSASGDIHDFRTCYELCANSYVVKPVEFEHLRDVSRAVARYWLTVNASPSSEPDLPNKLS